jgi:hypothetical protein
MGFDTCLWSPTRIQAGHDRYALMREPVRGSLSSHAYKDSGQSTLRRLICVVALTYL